MIRDVCAVRFNHAFGIFFSLFRRRNFHHCAPIRHDRSQFAHLVLGLVIRFQAFGSDFTRRIFFQRTRDCLACCNSLEQALLLVEVKVHVLGRDFLLLAFFLRFQIAVAARLHAFDLVCVFDVDARNHIRLAELLALRNLRVAREFDDAVELQVIRPVAFEIKRRAFWVFGRNDDVRVFQQRKLLFLDVECRADACAA